MRKFVHRVASDKIFLYRELADFFEVVHTDFARINKSIASSAAVMENWKEVSRLMTLADKSQTLLAAPM
jgi:hypothetical protein